MILTTEELLSMDYRGTTDEALRYARAIEAAVIKKLREQEPVAYMADDECGMSEFVDAYYVKLTGGQLPFPNAAEVFPLYLHPKPPEAR